VHLDVLGWVPHAQGGNRLGVDVLLLLISLMGGRLIPSLTRNWLARETPGGRMPAPFGVVDRLALGGAALALLTWVVAPDAAASAWTTIAPGVLVFGRLARCQGWRTWWEPLLLVLHFGYAWLGGGFRLLGLGGLTGWLAPVDVVHRLTVNAVATMTPAVMTRATLAHTGRALHVGWGTCTAYALVSLSALLRLAAPLAGDEAFRLLVFAGAAWSGAFGLFVVCCLGPLIRLRTRRSDAS
jgi:uncharacterized protein involved in response to NO